MNIDTVKAKAAKATIFGWFVGLAYYNWFAHQPPHVPFWGHLLLGFVGMFVASIVIGGGLALVAALLTRMTTGRLDGSSDFFAWGVFIGPVLAFFAAAPALLFVAS